MRVNPKKSSRIRFGARFSVKCSNDQHLNNCKLSSSDKLRCLGSRDLSRIFACFFSHARQSMYRAFNLVFSKVGRIASPGVEVKLVKSKCLPILCYGIDVCPVNKSHIGSLHYVVDNCFRKMFYVKSSKAVWECI